MAAFSPPDGYRKLECLKERARDAIYLASREEDDRKVVLRVLLASEPVVLENVPRIRDVETFLGIIAMMGAQVDWSGPNEVTIDAGSIDTDAIDGELAREIRASVLLAGPLLARFGRVQLPPPGGDVIGRRRMDTHFLAFEALGAKVSLDDGFTIQASGLRGPTCSSTSRP